MVVLGRVEPVDPRFERSLDDSYGAIRVGLFPRLGPELETAETYGGDEHPASAHGSQLDPFHDQTEPTSAGPARQVGGLRRATVSAGAHPPEKAGESSGIGRPDESPRPAARRRRPRRAGPSPRRGSPSPAARGSPAPSASVLAPCEVSSETYTGDSPGYSFTSRASSAITPAARRRASSRKRTSRRSATASNAGQLERDQLRLTLLLVVDLALDDEDPVDDAEVAPRHVGGVEDDHLGGAGRVVEREERPSVHRSSWSAA